MTTAKCVRLELGPLGFDDQWAELHDPKYLPNKKFEALLADLMKPDRTAEEAEAFFRSRIATWHVLDENGTQMPDASTADLGELPVGVTGAIGQKIKELFEVAVPNASRRP